MIYMQRIWSFFCRSIQDWIMNDWQRKYVPNLNTDIFKGKIDGTDTWFLAYDISYRDDDGYSRLTLKNVKKEHYTAFITEVIVFFYIGNPVLGTLIADKRGFAVYRCPEKNPYKGIIFSGYQIRYHITGYPFIISNPYYTPLRSDRDSPLSLHFFKVILISSASIYFF